jgi:phosphocarrier protein
MKELVVKINNKMGLHARPASKFVKTASSFSSKVTITANDKSADAKSILMVMSMAITQGTEIKISVEGTDEKECMEALTELINDNFGEEE